MDININIDDKIAKKFMKFFKLTNANNAVGMALTISSWVIDEAEKGRIMYSVDPDGNNKSFWLE